MGFEIKSFWQAFKNKCLISDFGFWVLSLDTFKVKFIPGHVIMVR